MSVSSLRVFGRKTNKDYKWGMEIDEEDVDALLCSCGSPLSVQKGTKIICTDPDCFYKNES